MSSKILSTLCILALLLLFSLTCAARPEPTFSDVTPLETHHADVEAEKVPVEESCKGLGEEECLMKRTLAAHIDYIYTQKQKP